MSDELTIYDSIGAGGVSAADVADRLKGFNGDTLDVRINSPGGSAFDGFAIYAQLKRHTATVNVTVDGVAASAASIVAMAGDSITMGDGSMMMVHEGRGGVFGSSADMRAWASLLDKLNAGLVGIYAKRTGKAEADVRTMLAAETWLTAAEAVAGKFADKVLDNSTATVDAEAARASVTEAVAKSRPSVTLEHLATVLRDVPTASSTNVRPITRVPVRRSEPTMTADDLLAAVTAPDRLT